MPEPSELDLVRVADAIDRRLPELAPSAPLMLLDTGFGSIVVETVRSIIVRVGRRGGSFAGYRLEQRLLPVIAPLLPVDVPSPKWFIEPCEEFALGAMAYSKIPGRTLSLELFAELDQGALADAIAMFLVALHRVDAASLPAVPMAGPAERRASDLELFRAAEPAIKRHLQRNAYARFEAFRRSYVSDKVMMEFDAVLTHGDPWYGNLLQGGAVDSALRARVARSTVIRELHGIRWAMEERSDDELAEGSEKLRHALG